jgi:hypothetical protein
MNRTLEDFLGLFLALGLIHFITHLIDPNANNNDETKAILVGVAYAIGRRQEQEARKTPKTQQPRPPIQHGGKQ